jgi:hypothetical protein
MTGFTLFGAADDPAASPVINVHYVEFTVRRRRMSP